MMLTSSTAPARTSSQKYPTESDSLVPMFYALVVHVEFEDAVAKCQIPDLHIDLIRQYKYYE